MYIMSFERKMVDGKPNPKYVDLCDEDQPIAGQKFVCMSFVSPEKILEQRDQFMFSEFVKSWDFTKSMNKFTDFIQFMAHKYSLHAESVMAAFKEFVDAEKEVLRSTPVTDDYRNFMDQHEEELGKEFDRKNSFQTSVRGLKIRGVYSSQEEAEQRCKSLREGDPHHDIFIGPVGMWIPWDPDAYKTGRVEFMEEELNQLHKEKIQNEQKAKLEFEARIREAKREAIEKNVAMATSTGNTLTQTIDACDNLVGVMETVDFESRDVADAEQRDAVNKTVLDSIINKSKED